MGNIFEELIRKFAELSNETAGEHFTPREVIRLMVNLIFAEDDEVLSQPGVVRTIYDPTAGTGGMLSVAGEWLHEHNPKARLTMFGQELNDESYAICKADLLIKGQDVGNIKPGTRSAKDGHAHQVFDYMLSNPPFGVEWKKSEKAVRRSRGTGFQRTIRPGLPRISDGSLLFMLHLVKKMRPRPTAGPVLYRPERFAAVHRRRWFRRKQHSAISVGKRSGRGHYRAAHGDVLQHRHLAPICGSSRTASPPPRKGKLQLIDACSFWQRMRKSLGDKRKELSPEHIDEITRIFCEFKEVGAGRRAHRR